MRPKPLLERTPTGQARSRDVTALLRERIVSGQWPTDTRIPTKLELRAELAVSDGTLQKALHALQREGFLRPRGRLGTFVTDHPPHLHRIGFVLPPDSEKTMWGRALRQVIEELGNHPSPGTAVYPDCVLIGDMPSAGLRQLETDLAKGLLAGVVALWGAPELSSRLLLNRPGLARVDVGHPDAGRHHPWIRLTSIDSRAMACFQAAGRRRLAIVATFNHYADQCAEIIACARTHGLETRHRWIHYFNPDGNISARAVMELMMSIPRRNRPDAVYITDDHLVTEAVLGLANGGARVPQKLTVIGHANFPFPPGLPMRIRLLGPDLECVVRTAIHLVGDQLAGRPVPAETVLHPVFDDEWEQGRPHKTKP